MKRVINGLVADIRFQYNQGFYFIYLILSFIYVSVIYQTGEKVAVILTPVLLYFDPAMVGFMFTGGMVMLEKQQGLTSYIGITPFKTLEYIAVRTISMAGLALFASLIICTAVWKPFNILTLMTGIILVSAFHTLLGLHASSKCRSMNDYFIRMIPYMLIIILPVLGFLDSNWFVILRYFPGFAGLRIILNAFNNGIEAHILQDISVMVVWITAIVTPVARKFDKEMIRG